MAARYALQQVSTPNVEVPSEVNQVEDSTSVGLAVKEKPKKDDVPGKEGEKPENAQVATDVESKESKTGTDAASVETLVSPEYRKEG
jgi:hypothetical protein